MLIASVKLLAKTLPLPERRARGVADDELKDSREKIERGRG